MTSFHKFADEVGDAASIGVDEVKRKLTDSQNDSKVELTNFDATVADTGEVKVEIDATPPLLHDESKFNLTKEAAKVSVEEARREREQLRWYLDRLQMAAAISPIVNVVVTVILFFMGYSEGLKDEKKPSVTVVVLAFGALETAILSAVECWQTFANTAEDKDIPTWRWHNKAFLYALCNFVFMASFLWPSMIVFMLHSKGDNFPTVVSNLKSDKLSLFSFSFHICAGTLLALLDLLAIAWAFSKLKHFHQAEDAELDGDNVPPVGKDKSSTQLMTEAIVPVTFHLRILAGLVGVVQVAFLVNTFIIAVGEPVNSGAIIVLVVTFIITLLYFAASVLFIRAQTMSENWLLNFRLVASIHMVLHTCLFWVDISIIVFRKQYTRGFFETLGDLPKSGDVILCVVLLLVFLLGCLSYGTSLLLHSRVMNALDAIYALAMQHVLYSRQSTKRLVRKTAAAAAEVRRLHGHEIIDEQPTSPGYQPLLSPGAK